MKRVVVHIENLVLKGFRYEDRHRVAAALQVELTRVLAQPGAAERLTELGSARQLRLDNVNVGPNAIPQQIGSETARAIGRGLTK